MEKLQLGIIGLRNQGSEHLGASELLKHARIAAICDTDEREITKALEGSGELKAYRSVEEILADTNLDGLVLALPHHAYEDIWESIVARKLPVLKEKPLGRSLSEAFWLFETARRNDCYLQTAIQRRSHPSYDFLKNKLAGHQIYSVAVSMHLGFDPEPDPHGWRGVPEHAGGGVVLDYGYHAIDLLLFLLDDLQLVNASLWRGNKPATAERLESEARLICRSGATWVHVDLRVGGEPDPDEEGTWMKKEVVSIDYDEGRMVADRSKVSLDDEIVFECDRGWERAMASQLDDFALNIRNRTYDQESVWEQIPAMKLVEQIYTGAGIVRPPEQSAMGGGR